MRTSALLLGLLGASSLAACGGSSFESGAPSGQAGAGGGVAGSAGAATGGSAGTTSGGSAGATSGGGAGTTSGGSAGATSGGSAGSTSGGSGGKGSGGNAGSTSGGSAGTTSAGSGGSTGGGSAGSMSAGSGGGTSCATGTTECVGPSSVRTCVSGVWSAPVACPVSSSACDTPVCVQGACGSSGTAPPDVPHDCQKTVCSSGSVSVEPDPNDLPASLGPCDVPSCNGSTPAHAATDSKCSAVRRCDADSGYKCVCRVCPAGSVAGLPGGECAIGNGTTKASATSTIATSDPAEAIDTSASTRWLPGAGDASLTLDVPALPMQAIVVYPSVVSSVVNPTTIDWTVDVIDAAGKSSSYVQQVKYQAGDPPPLKVMLNAPIVVEKIVIRGKSAAITWGIFEVTYVLCG